jgi:hypothetical protein
MTNVHGLRTRRFEDGNLKEFEVKVEKSKETA